MEDRSKPNWLQRWGHSAPTCNDGGAPNEETMPNEIESEWLELEDKNAKKEITSDEFRRLCYLRRFIDPKKLNALIHPSLQQK